jgi:hypothetical protein
LPSLEEALLAAGCSKFLAWLKASPEVWNLFTSGVVKSVFAPSDEYFVEPSQKKRQWNPRNALKALQGSNNLNILAEKGVDETFNDNANLDGKNQTVVTTRRADSQPQKRQVLSDTIAEVASGLGDVAKVKRGDIPYIDGLIHVTDR